MIDKDFIINQLEKCLADKDTTKRLEILLDIIKDMPEEPDNPPVVLRKAPKKEIIKPPKYRYYDPYPIFPTEVPTIPLKFMCSTASA